jgi:hypothetical protein
VGDPIGTSGSVKSVPRETHSPETSFVGLAGAAALVVTGAAAAIAAWRRA